jgi:outer membrane protein OmpA-like peptidoglycan-associated protein
MSNLFDLVKGLFGDDLVQRLQPFLGLDSKQAHRAADAVVPALIGGLINRIQTDGGAESVFEFVKPYLGSKFDFAKTWAPEGGVVELLNSGYGLVTSIYGDQLGETTKAIAKAAAIPDHEAAKLLEVTAPGVLGSIGSLLGEGASIEDFTKLLSAEVPNLEGKLPAGLPFDSAKLAAGLGAMSLAEATISGNAEPVVEVPATPSFSGLRITVDDTEEVAAANYANVAAPVAAVAAAAPVVESVTTASTVAYASVGGGTPDLAKHGNTRSGLIGWGAAGIFGLGLLGWYLANNNVSNIATAPVTESASASPLSSIPRPDGKVSMPMATESKRDPISNGGLSEVEISGGIKLNAKADGIEFKLVDFIKSDKPVDKKTWFSFDRLYFDTAKSSIKPESKAQLENIAAIMKAYPKVKLKIGGYTDNQGNDSFNMKLSADRANATVNALVALGVDQTRLDPEGYGKQFPVATNDTEEGRAKNRRIDVRVTEK